MYKDVRELHEHIFKVWLRYCQDIFNVYRNKEEMPRIEIMFDQIMIEYRIRTDKKMSVKPHKKLSVK